jgi:hypothetical protein
MGLNEFLGKWGVFLCSIADGAMIVRRAGSVQNFFSLS